MPFWCSILSVYLRAAGVKTSIYKMGHEESTENKASVARENVANVDVVDLTGGDDALRACRMRLLMIT